MSELAFELVDETSFDQIPAPARPHARCQTCDYWERIDGGREAPAADATDAVARAGLKRRRLLAGRAMSGSYGMLAYLTDAVERTPIGYAQFGPLSAYPRAQSIRDRYPHLPESPSPWVITCIQVLADPHAPDERAQIGIRLLEAVCSELDRRGIIAVEAYPEAAGDDRYPVYRRELTGETDAGAWSDLIRASRPDDEDDDWPLPLPPKRDPDDLFRLPPEKPKRPNPFGEE
jgi:hypothetical protein